MTAELNWMLLTVLMTSIFWSPYIVDRLVVRGFFPALMDRRAETFAPHSEWAQRAIRAHANAIENLAIFVPAVLALHLLNVSTPLTRAAAATYFFARLIHFLTYAAGVPMLRTLAFAVGWMAQVALLVSALKWV